MRTVTDAQEAIYSLSSHARACWTKVEVYSDITSAWVDLTNYLGYNWIRSVSISESLDSPVATAEVSLFLLAGPQGEMTSSPFVTETGMFSFPSGFSTYNALVYPYKRIRISLAVTPLDVPPSSSDWMLKFVGRITKSVVTESGVQLSCRDSMGELADLFIEAEKEYGSSTSTVDIEDVIQSILTDTSSGVTLWSVNGSVGTEFDPGDSPAWAVNKYLQQRQTVMDAIKALADQIGFDLRYQWQTNAGDFKLVLSDPERTSPTVARTISLSQMTSLNVSLDVMSIRNYIRVLYTNKGNQRMSVDAEDTTSQGAYGRRFMEISEEVTSTIDTDTEAQELADRALLDLHLPKAQISGDIPLFPNVELNDYLGFLGDDRISGDYDLAVVNITHTVDGNIGKTSLVCTGSPASRRNWINAQQTQSVKPVGYRNNLTFASNSRNLLCNGDLSQWTGS
jgi:hypothetical protein